MQKQTNLKWLLTIAFLILWLFVAYAVFYLVQKPFDQAFATAVSDASLNVLSSLLIVLLGAALGLRLTRLLGVSFASPGCLLYTSPSPRD